MIFNQSISAIHSRNFDWKTISFILCFFWAYGLQVKRNERQLIWKFNFEWLWTTFNRYVNAYVSKSKRSIGRRPDFSGRLIGRLLCMLSLSYCLAFLKIGSSERRKVQTRTFSKSNRVEWRFSVLFGVEIVFDLKSKHSNCQRSTLSLLKCPMADANVSVGLYPRDGYKWCAAQMGTNSVRQTFPVICFETTLLKMKFVFAFVAVFCLAQVRLWSVEVSSRWQLNFR